MTNIILKDIFFLVLTRITGRIVDNHLYAQYQENACMMTDDFQLISLIDHVSVACQNISVENGTVRTNGSYPGDLAEVVCKSSFELRGSQTLTCLFNGSWSEPVPSCQQKGR